jgi:hypothetical protein
MLLYITWRAMSSWYDIWHGGDVDTYVVLIKISLATPYLVYHVVWYTNITLCVSMTMCIHLVYTHDDSIDIGINANGHLKHYGY